MLSLVNYLCVQITDVERAAMRSGLNIEIDFSIHKTPYMGRIPDHSENFDHGSEKVTEVVLSEQED